MQKIDKVLVDKTFISKDEEYNAASRITEDIEKVLLSVKTDTHNKLYLIRVIVTELEQ